MSTTTPAQSTRRFVFRFVVAVVIAMAIAVLVAPWGNVNGILMHLGFYNLSELPRIGAIIAEHALGFMFAYFVLRKLIFHLTGLDDISDLRQKIEMKRNDSHATLMKGVIAASTMVALSTPYLFDLWAYLTNTVFRGGLMMLLAFVMTVVLSRIEYGLSSIGAFQEAVDEPDNDSLPKLIASTLTWASFFVLVVYRMG